MYADSFIRAPRLTLPENLGLDEISSSMAKYGGSYLCVFVDNNHRTLNEILPNRSKVTLSKHFEMIPQSERDKVKYVTIDMWEPYRDVCKKYLRHCEIAVDPFHVIKHLTECFTRIRVGIMKQCVYDSPSYYLLKTWHKLLETDSFDLDNEPRYNSKFRQKMNYRDLYNMLLEISPDLKLAYELKELYRDFNKRCSFEEASMKLDYLIEVSNGYTNLERFCARALYCLNDKLFYCLTTCLYSRKREHKKRGTYTKHLSDTLINDY